MRLQTHNIVSSKSHPFTQLSTAKDISTKLLDMELIGGSSHCFSCKFNFPILQSKFTQSIDSNDDKLLEYTNSHKKRVIPPYLKKEDDAKSKRIKLLEKDLDFLKNQLNDLTYNKNFILGVIGDLKSSYVSLLHRNESQEREINMLKSYQPQHLALKDDLSLVEMKSSLDSCDTKLDRLDEIMTELLRCYQDEMKGPLFNSTDLEPLHNDVAHVHNLYKEINTSCEDYLQKMKPMESNELSSFIGKLQNACNSDTSEQIKQRYRIILEKQRTVEAKIRELEKYHSQRDHFPECVLCFREHFIFGHRPPATGHSSSVLEKEMLTHNFAKIYVHDDCRVIDEDYELECVCEPCED